MEYLPYIVSVIVAIISGVSSYAAASKKASNQFKMIEESNKYEISKLMEQHKLDIESLERKHEMEIEKLNIEHKHQLEMKDRDLEMQLSGAMFSSVMQHPSVQGLITQIVEDAKPNT